MTYQLRPYQQAAIDSIYSYYSSGNKGHALVSLPTGSGKSLVQAEFVRGALVNWPDQRFLLLSHVKELLQQNADQLLDQWPEADVGIYSAGLGRKELGHAITIAGVQSIHKKAYGVGWISVVIIDECHLLSRKSSSMYATLLAKLWQVNPKMKLIGLTATPYRLDSGSLTQGKGALFSDVVYEADVKELIGEGYLSPLVSRLGASRPTGEIAQLGKRGGEFIAAEAGSLMEQSQIVSAALDEVEALAEGRSKWLIFCVTVEHAATVKDHLTVRQISSAVVTGDTPKEARAGYLRRFKAGEIKALININVLTTGFNVPDLDCLVMLRPTMSAGLYVQMLGRGMRTAPGKTDCLVLDFAENILRHGPIDKIKINPKTGEVGSAPMKECPGCQALLFISAKDCGDCGYVFVSEPTPKHGTMASSEALLSVPVVTEVNEYEVRRVTYAVHQKTGSQPSLRADYDCGLNRFSEWVCLEHEGFALRKAQAWWVDRCDSRVPVSVVDALQQSAKLKQPTGMSVRTGGKYPKIEGFTFGVRDDSTDGEQLGLPSFFRRR